MLPPKMQSRSKTQPERPSMSEPGLFVGRKAHQPSGSVNLGKSQSRERRQVRRLDPSRPVAQSSWPSPEASQVIRLAADKSVGVGAIFRRARLHVRLT